MSAPEVIASMPREKLEEQLMKNLKYIKILKKQSNEAVASVAELDNKLKNQIEENNKLIDMVNRLQDENTKLIETQKSNSQGFGIGNIGKTLTSIIATKKNEYKLELKLDTTTLKPTINENEDDSPQFKALKIEYDSLNQKFLKLSEEEKTLRSFSDSLQSKLENCEKERESLSLQLDKIKEEYGKKTSDFDQLSEKFKESENKLSNTQKELAELKSNTQNMELKLPALLSAQAELKAVTESRNSAIEQYERIKDEVIGLRVKNDENLRQIEQYKDGLKKAMRIDKERDNEIHQLKNKITDNEIEKSDLQKQIEGYKSLQSNQDGREKELKDKIEELEKRLENGKASEEVEQKVKKMNKMLEKSNCLYAELQEKFSKIETRAKDLEIKLYKARVPGVPVIRFACQNTSYTLYDNGIFQEKVDVSGVRTITCCDARKRDASTQNEENYYSYSEQLMRTYFLSDDSTRKDISVVIMKVLHFTDEEIKKETSRKRSGFRLL